MTHVDPIKITDAQGLELSYATLDTTEKENILTDLLFQSALQNIAIKQIVSKLCFLKEEPNSTLLNRIY